MARTKKPAIPLVTMTKVIRDCRDGRLDYKIPLAEAKKLYNEGKLCWDCTNGAYAEIKK